MNTCVYLIKSKDTFIILQTIIRLTADHRCHIFMGQPVALANFYHDLSDFHSWIKSAEAYVINEAFPSYLPP